MRKSTGWDDNAPFQPVQIRSFYAVQQEFPFVAKARAPFLIRRAMTEMKGAELKCGVEGEVMLAFSFTWDPNPPPVQNTHTPPLKHYLKQLNGIIFMTAARK